MKHFLAIFSLLIMASFCSAQDPGFPSEEASRRMQMMADSANSAFQHEHKKELKVLERLIANNKPEEALEILIELIEQHPGIECLFALAEQAYRKESLNKEYLARFNFELEKLKKEYSEYLEIYPDDREMKRRLKRLNSIIHFSIHENNLITN
ncbi:MAG: hypothetical protein QNK23_13255 [Crocinitomicaceae bacterium]|nr:hypothetical protein [Crocinitomicaceae bacterium]